MAADKPSHLTNRGHGLQSLSISLAPMRVLHGAEHRALWDPGIDWWGYMDEVGGFKNMSAIVFRFYWDSYDMNSFHTLTEYLNLPKNTEIQTRLLKQN